MPPVQPRGAAAAPSTKINMVPFIDVMLVLLIIFMVNHHGPGMDLCPPSAKAKQQPDRDTDHVGSDDRACASSSTSWAEA